MVISDQPLVSVVIPSFNQSKFIEETINSVLLQNYRPLEIIVIDACSTDGTIDKLHKYDNVSEVRWISEHDNGHADGVNKGFILARGEIIAWINSDDVYYSTDVVKMVVEYFTKKPKVDVVYGDVAIISINSTLLRLFLLPPFNKERILRQNYISQPAVFIRKYVVDEEKLNINQVGLDYEYWLRLLIKGYCFSHTNKIFACDRHYPERISVNQKSIIESQIAIVKKRLGLSRPNYVVLHFIDRIYQAFCRIKGFMLLVFMAVLCDKDKIVFPIKIDSYPKLLWRQMTKAVGSDFKFKRTL